MKTRPPQYPPPAPAPNQLLRRASLEEKMLQEKMENANPTSAISSRTVKE